MDYVSFYSPVYIEILPAESYLSLKFLVNFAEFAFNFDQAYHITSEQFNKENLVKKKATAKVSKETSFAPLNLAQVITLVAIAILLPIGICLFAIKLWHHWDGFRIASTEEKKPRSHSTDSTSEKEGPVVEKLADTLVVDQSNLADEIRSSSSDSTSEQEGPVVEKLVDTAVFDQSNLAKSKGESELIGDKRETDNPVPFSFVITTNSSVDNIKKTAETKILHLNVEQYQLLSNAKMNCKILDLYKLDQLKNPITVRLDDPTDEFPFRGLLNPQTDHLREGLRDPGFAMLGETLNLFLEMESFKF